MARNDDFDLRALFDALDAQRQARGLSWKATAAEVSRFRTVLRPIAASTMTALRDTPVAEGDGILQMLLWLGRTPESFVPGVADADGVRFQLPSLSKGEILRWHCPALHAAAQLRRTERGLTWAETAKAVGGCTAPMLTRLSRDGRTALPHVMRLVRWLERPAVAFTKVARW